MRRVLPLVASGLALAAAAAPPAPLAPPDMTEASPVAPARLPGFAAELAAAPRIEGPSGWRAAPLAETLAGLAAASSSMRQSARWTYALAQIAAGRAAEALGVLDTMLADDPDLGLVDDFQLARGRVLVELDRFDAALTTLDRPGLALRAEACAWRGRAFSGIGADSAAVRQLPCAKPALAARRGADRVPFLIAAADSAVAVGDAAAGLRFLSYLPDTPAVALARGRALLALRRYPEARLAFAAGARGSRRSEQVEGALGQIEVGVLRGDVPPARALAELTRLRATWRGDRVERRALWLSYKLARELHDDPAALAAGATLIRYQGAGPALPSLLADLQTILAGLLAPESRLPLDRAAGLYWDYRDLSPNGAAGDLLVSRLADRLQASGLYARAAALLEHQLLTRARDLVQGPLSVRVAKLHILAGAPDKALAALKATAGTLYPSGMLWDRQRVEAIALQQLGRGKEAVAVLQDVPDAEGLRAELLWRQRDWGALVAAGEPAPSARLTDVAQTRLLRRAIALAMLGRAEELAGLRARFADAFAGLPSAAAFELLTRPGGAVDPDAFAKAMTAIPTASPAGRLADLIDAAPHS